MRKLMAIVTALSVLGLTGVLPLYSLATAETATDPAKSDPPKAPKKAKKKKKKKEKEKEKTTLLYRIAA